MGIQVYFDAVLELFNSILSKFDQWMFSNFDIATSLADNGEQVIVYVFALIIIGFLMVLLVSNSSQKNNLQKFDSDENSQPTLQSSSDYVPSLISANSDAEILATETNDVSDIDKPIEPNDDIRNDLKTSDQPNIYKLDNGFVVNKRSAYIQEDKKADGNSDDRQAETVKNAVETNTDPLGTAVAVDKKLHMSGELATIETEMLDVRKKYKSGKISSLDYITKTQELYKKGEVLAESSKSFD
tara:strand:+ start:152 stop:877 length:726 start_codon:yes stop_codon:yes gene_type:complete